jgi:hypothetical protein
MAHNRVVNDGEVSLDGRIYRLAGPVRRSLASQFPQKLIIGDYNEESNPITSVFTISDQRGGIGQNVLESETDVTRCWFASGVDLRYKGHIVLAPKIETSTGGPGQNFLPTRLVSWAENSSFGFLDTYVLANGDALLGGSKKTVSKFTPDTGAFETKQGVSDIGGERKPTDFKAGVVNGTQVMLVCDGSTSGFKWTDTPAESSIAWQSDTHAITQTAFWRGMLFGVTSSGETVFSSDLASGFTSVAQFPDKAFDAVRKLFTAADETGAERLYAAATTGLWVYDNANERWLRTALQFSYEPHVTATVWRNSIYVAAGLSMFNFVPPNQIISMGLDRDDGLPGRFVIRGSGDRAHIVGLESTPAALYALTTVPFAPSYSGTAGLFRWNELGWDLVFESPTDSESYLSGALAHNDADGVYRFIFTESSPYTNENSGANGGTVHHFSLDRQVNPSVPGFNATYSSSGTWESPWIEKTGSQEFTAHQVIVRSDHPTSSETLSIQYALDYDDTSEGAYKAIATRSVSGEASYLLPGASEPSGIDFRAFKFKVDFRRGDDESKSPDLRRISLVFSKNLQPLWQFGLQLDLTESAGGYSPREMRKALERQITGSGLVEFTYRNEDGGAETHFVRVLQPQSVERSGHMESTEYQLTLVEPVPARTGA